MCIRDRSDMGLRYDLTLPLSRYYAANRDKLPSPFKVIQTDRVFRAERPQKVASQPAGDEGRRSASQKRIEDYAARRTPRLARRFAPLLRIGGVVLLVADFGRHPPDRPFVPALGAVSYTHLQKLSMAFLPKGFRPSTMTRLKENTRSRNDLVA